MQVKIDYFLRMTKSNFPARLFSKTAVHCLVSVAFGSVILVSQSADAQDSSVDEIGPFEIAHLSVEPGQKLSDSLPVSAGSDGVATFIPVTVLHGAKPGPVLSLIAGIHGSEYSPIVSMQRLPGFLDPSEMSGTLIIVQIANIPAFKGRTIYVGPNDLKNLNRSFPGSETGTVTERIAHTLTNEVLIRSDYLIDIHSGDANESLRPSYAAYYAEAGGQSVIEESERIALAFGLETIVRFAGSYASVDDAIYTSAQAVSRGVAAMDVESGELGSIDDAYVDPIIRGSLNVLQELNMIEGTPDLPSNPLIISDRARVYSNHEGIWYGSPLVKTGDYVTEGAKLGVITDYHGNELTTITAPASGVLLVLFGTPPINMGDNIAVIGKISNIPED